MGRPSYCATACGAAEACQCWCGAGLVVPEPSNVLALHCSFHCCCSSSVEWCSSSLGRVVVHPLHAPNRARTDRALLRTPRLPRSRATCVQVHEYERWTAKDVVQLDPSASVTLLLRCAWVTARGTLARGSQRVGGTPRSARWHTIAGSLFVQKDVPAWPVHSLWW